MQNAHIQEQDRDFPDPDGPIVTQILQRDATLKQFVDHCMDLRQLMVANYYERHGDGVDTTVARELIISHYASAAREKRNDLLIIAFATLTIPHPEPRLCHDVVRRGHKLVEELAKTP